MLYVEQSLGPDEELVHVGQFHWFYTVTAFASILWGVVGSLIILQLVIVGYMFMERFPQDISFYHAIQYMHPGFKILAFVIFILGVMSFAQKMIVKATTEIAITNNRLVYKRGLIARNVGEISIDRIEGVNVLQSIFGRIFNYGRLSIRGMGIGEVILPPIESPIVFRQEIEKARSI